MSRVRRGVTANSRHKKVLDKARSKELIQDRREYLCDLVQGKNVLDIGVVEHFHESVSSENWLHKHIRESAKDCLGIDIFNFVCVGEYF